MRNFLSCLIFIFFWMDMKISLNNQDEVDLMMIHPNFVPLSSLLEGSSSWTWCTYIVNMGQLNGELGLPIIPLYTLDVDTMNDYYRQTHEVFQYWFISTNQIQPWA